MEADIKDTTYEEIYRISKGDFVLFNEVTQSFLDYLHRRHKLNGFHSDGDDEEKKIESSSNNDNSVTLIEH